MSLVLFDIDGTLLRRAGPHHRAALCSGIKRVTGLDTTLDGIDTSGMLDRDLIAVMLRAAGVSATRTRTVLRQIMSETALAYAGDCPPDLTDRVCQGVLETLTELHRRAVVLGVVSGNLTEIGWKKLQLAGLREFFSVAGFAEDGRTRARLALVACRRARRAGLIAKGDKVTLIGDHFNDVTAAKQSGFQSVAVGTGLTPIELLATAQPDILVPDLSHLRIESLL